MKTLEASYFKSLLHKQRKKERGVCCGFRQEFGFLVHQNLVPNGLSMAVSFQPSAVSSPQTNVTSEEISAISSDQPKSVHVRFKLHKECAFGQQFLLVGDDPIIGLWDPSDGVPLDWSDGHVWTTEVDLPCGKVIKYKFILEGNNGTMIWQHGADRILETWDTEKTISVYEDWDNPELQNVVEEEHANEEPLINSDSSFFPEKLNQTIVEEGNTNNDHTNHLDEPSLVMVAENICEELREQDSSLNDEKQEESSTLEDRTRLVLDEGDPDLKPGLVPILPVEQEVEAEEVNEVENSVFENATSESEAKDIDEVENNVVRNRTSEFDEIEEQELKDEHVVALLHSIETSKMVDEKQQIYGEHQQHESNIFENDMQWGRRALQKFLANLGLI